MDDYFILLIIGIIFLFVIFWETRKDKIQLMELEKGLEEKEKRLYELYEAFESIIQYTLTEVEDNETEVTSARTMAIQDNSLYSSTLPDKQPNEETKYPEYKYNNRRKAVILLYKSGNTEEEIAKKLGIGIGEVRLILGLKRY